MTCKKCQHWIESANITMTSLPGGVGLTSYRAGKCGMTMRVDRLLPVSVAIKVMETRETKAHEGANCPTFSAAGSSDERADRHERAIISMQQAVIQLQAQVARL